MISDSPRNARRLSRSSSTSGFTLIELLMVVAVILVLAGITFGVSRGVQNAQARSKVKGELAILAQALEEFKASNGDYPWLSDNPTELSKALLGWKKFVRATNVTFDDKAANEVPSTGPKAFIDPTKLDYAGTLPTTATTAPSNIQFLDPWGQAYVYEYKTGAADAWDNFGYVLYSRGADGEHTPVADDGVLTQAIRDNDLNIDNIYSGE